jgi:hypothetical protein
MDFGLSTLGINTINVSFHPWGITFLFIASSHLCQHIIDNVQVFLKNIARKPSIPGAFISPMENKFFFTPSAE